MDCHFQPGGKKTSCNGPSWTKISHKKNEEYREKRVQENNFKAKI